MSNLYPLRARIHELLPQINQKYGLEIEVESDFYWYVETSYFEGVHKRPGCFYKDDGFYERVFDAAIDDIQAPQIRQILVGLQEVLGENPELHSKRLDNYSEFLEAFKNDTPIEAKYTELKNEAIPEFQAEVLCQKWLDGITPLFDREPEPVLQELVEVLEHLLK